MSSVPRASIAESIKEPEILASFKSTLNKLRRHRATIVDSVEYPTWTPDFSHEMLPFVWGQLKSCKKAPPPPAKPLSGC